MAYCTGCAQLLAKLKQAKAELAAEVEGRKADAKRAWEEFFRVDDLRKQAEAEEAKCKWMLDEACHMLSDAGYGFPRRYSIEGIETDLRNRWAAREETP